MTASWTTKWGKRRVRHEPPTLAEALVAAEGFTDNGDQQIEIAAALMGVGVDSVRVEARKLASERRSSVTVVSPLRERGTRTVVVERKVSRRMLPRDDGQRGTGGGLRAR